MEKPDGCMDEPCSVMCKPINLLYLSLEIMFVCIGNLTSYDYKVEILLSFCHSSWYIHAYVSHFESE